MLPSTALTQMQSPTLQALRMMPRAERRSSDDNLNFVTFRPRSHSREYDALAMAAGLRSAAAHGSIAGSGGQRGTQNPSSRSRGERSLTPEPLPSPSLLYASLSHATPFDTREAQWTLLNDDILEFARQCSRLQEQQREMREELASRTRWAIRTVWPTAQVDLVGSVAAAVALPKSDLDFVIYFQPTANATQQPPCFSHTVANSSPLNAPLNANAASSATVPASVPFFTAQVDAAVWSDAVRSAALSPESNLADSSRPSSGTLTQYFAHAGSLIKLIGGRKKSKLLFRSTKIQVFKDINLIRLRDGLSGISMDLWFPVSSVITLRSQQHTAFIRAFTKSCPPFVPLACVVKSFMMQNR
jgi:hypothetical protein